MRDSVSTGPLSSPAPAAAAAALPRLRSPGAHFPCSQCVHFLGAQTARGGPSPAPSTALITVTDRAPGPLVDVGGDSVTGDGDPQ